MADLLDYNDIFEAMITASLGPRTSGIRAQVNQNQRTRGNTPLAGVGRKLAINSPAYNVPAGVLWIGMSSCLETRSCSATCTD